MYVAANHIKECSQSKTKHLNDHHHFNFQANVKSLCATNLFQILDKRINHDVYSNQYACDGMKVSFPDRQREREKEGERKIKKEREKEREKGRERE